MMDGDQLYQMKTNRNVATLRQEKNIQASK